MNLRLAFWEKPLSLLPFGIPLSLREFDRGTLFRCWLIFSCQRNRKRFL